MRSDNLRLPCVQPSTSQHNLQLPPGHHGCLGHGGHGSHGSHGFMVIMVVLFVIVILVGVMDMMIMDRTGRDIILGV